MPETRPRCQNDDLTDSSTHMNVISVQAGVVANSYRKSGALPTLVRIARTLVWKPLARVLPQRKRGAAALPATAPAAEVLNLQPGELVRIKPREEVLRTLDAEGRHRGLTVMPEMLEHCGREYRVHNRVNKMLLEGTGEMRRVKNTVLLKDCMCSGEPIGCDRSCFFFWREAWLERVEPKSE